jgi:formylmethanofuran dehydrogenase subunit B
MTAPATDAWTCPFCPLACDAFVPPRAGPSGFEWLGDACGRARSVLAAHHPDTTRATPEVDGRAATHAQAIARAAQILADSRQPLFAGLGADVAGARALYPLACATGAICDALGGDALMLALRALQDRGQFTTTLAEVRERADLIVFIGALPGDAAPLLAQRLGLAGAASGARARRVVVLGAAPGDAAELARWSAAGIDVQALPFDDDLFSAVRWLAGRLAPRPVPGAPPALQQLAAALLDARYAVLVGAPARLPAHGGLIVETVHQIVNQLNLSTRAAALWVGGGDGAATSNQVFTWLSGLPLRSRAGPLGLEHEPLCFGAQRLIDDGAIDALLWVSCFDAAALPPPNRLPMVVLGPAALGPAVRREGAVFIPVATPGLGAAGHVFRTDGTVLLPLRALHGTSLLGVADVARELMRALETRAEPE